jgi:murein DD-endopeptidase MepM/ murein hydrolase activator NlpD
MRTTLVVLVTAWVVLAGAASPNAAPAESFTWPLQPRAAVVTAFDPPEYDWLPGHRGVDLAGAPNQTVHAIGEGVVVFADIVAGKPVVSIDHPNGLRSTYEPVRGSVVAGARVRRGDPIGVLATGHPGCPSTCLHWGLRRDRVYLDPLALLRLTPIRLKPLETG